MGSTVVNEIISEGIQLMIMGATDKLAQAQVIFNQLVDDLTAHGTQSLQAATEMVQNAIKQVAELLSNLE